MVPKEYQRFDASRQLRYGHQKADPDAEAERDTQQSGGHAKGCQLSHMRHFKVFI